MFNKLKNFGNRIVKKVMTIGTAAVACVAMAANAFAVNAEVDALFTAVDVTSVKSNVVTLLTAAIVVSVIFVGARYVRKGLGAFR